MSVNLNKKKNTLDLNFFFFFLLEISLMLAWILTYIFQLWDWSHSKFQWS